MFTPAEAHEAGRVIVSHQHPGTNASEEILVNPMFARSGETSLPRWRIPDGEMLPDSAYQIIHWARYRTCRERFRADIPPGTASRKDWSISDDASEIRHVSHSTWAFRHFRHVST